MILVDTSMLIDHLRKHSPTLAALLSDGEVAVHPFVIGELACGNLKNREEILSLLGALPDLARVRDDEVLAFIETNQLHGKGLGLIDIHLLASARLEGLPLWTKDKCLATAAENFGLRFSPR